MSFVVPDACSLPTVDRPLRLAEFDRLVAASVRRVEPISSTHARLRLAGAAGLTATVRDLTAREAGCCSFFAFTLTPELADEGEAATLDIEVPPDYADVLAALTWRASARAVPDAGQ